MRFNKLGFKRLAAGVLALVLTTSSWAGLVGGGGGTAFTGGTLTSALNYAATVTIASASTVAIGAAASNAVIISGTTTVTAFDTVAAGVERSVVFSGALVLTHNGTSLQLPGSVSIKTATNDSAVFRSLGSGNWICLSYQRASKISKYLLQATTASATPVTFTTDGLTAGTGNQVVLLNNTTYAFYATAVCRDTTHSTSASLSGPSYPSIIYRGANAASTTLAATLITMGLQDMSSTWVSVLEIAITADTTNGAMKFSAIGQAATAYVCSLVVDVVELNY